MVAPNIHLVVVCCIMSPGVCCLVRLVNHWCGFCMVHWCMCRFVDWLGISWGWGWMVDGGWFCVGDRCWVSMVHWGWFLVHWSWFLVYWCWFLIDRLLMYYWLYNYLSVKIKLNCIYLKEYTQYLYEFTTPMCV